MGLEVKGLEHDASPDAEGMGSKAGNDIPVRRAIEMVDLDGERLQEGVDFGRCNE